MSNPQPKAWDRTLSVMVLLMGVSGSLATQSNRYVRVLGIAWLITGAGWAIVMLAKKSSVYPKSVMVFASFAASAAFPLGIVAMNQPKQASPYCQTPNSSIGVNSATLAIRPPGGQAGPVLDKVLVEEEHSAGALNCIRLDATLRNSEPGAHIVDLAEIRILKTWDLPFSCTIGGKGGGGLPPSHNYQTVVNLDNAPVVVPLEDLDEQLNGSDTDRFTVTAKLEKSPAKRPAVVATFVEAQLDLYADGEATPLSSGPFIFLASPGIDMRNLLYATTDIHDVANASQNSVQLQEMANESSPTTTTVKALEQAAAAQGKAARPPACPT